MDPSPLFRVPDLLRQHLPARGRRCALVDDAREISYFELDQRVRELAGWLLERGLEPGDRVAVCMRKTWDEVAAMLAASYCGGVFVNLHLQWTGRQLDHALADCGARYLIGNPQVAAQVGASRALPELQAMLCLGGEPPEAADGRISGFAPPAEVPAAPRPGGIDSDLAAILYTSGSTGPPKGVMLSHRNLVDGARVVVSYLHNHSDDRVLSVLPFSFDYGLNQLISMLWVGGCLVLQPVALATSIVQSLATWGCTGLAGVPPLWVQLVRLLQESPTELPELRYITNSGGKIPAGTLAGLPEALPGTDIVLMYGLTEAFRSTWLPPEHFAARPGSMGIAVPNNQVFVINDTGPCADDEVGELVHRGSLVSMGYWGRPEDSAARIRPCPQLRALIGEEPVVYSGDLCRRDADGFLWFVGRRDQLIKCSGFRISPQEVEDVLSEHPAVAECLAFGVDHEELGQVVHAAVSLQAGAKFAPEELRRHCAGALAAHMLPRRFHHHPGPLPKTNSGKLDAAAVAALYRDAAPGG